MTAPALRQATADRRREFVTFLYRVHRDLTADNRYAAAASRAILARLRRSFAGPRQQAEAYQIVFDFDPPEHEQHIWLLTGGLFALHPRPRPAGSERSMSIGAALGALADAGAVSAGRRFTQLISVDHNALAYYLRQAVQLLRGGQVGLDYYRLLDELAVLLAENETGQQAQRSQDIRIAWIRDFPRNSIRQANPKPPAPTLEATP
jgi:CRISPR system Cascade subunit CasB